MTGIRPRMGGARPLFFQVYKPKPKALQLSRSTPHSMFLSATALLLLLTCLGAVSQELSTLHRRRYFYVGQTYIPQGNSSIANGQMYVEHLIPTKVSPPFPLMIIHGNCKS
jgi:hypothetical protein